MARRGLRSVAERESFQVAGVAALVLGLLLAAWAVHESRQRRLRAEVERLTQEVDAQTARFTSAWASRRASWVRDHLSEREVLARGLAAVEQLPESRAGAMPKGDWIWLTPPGRPAGKPVAAYEDIKPLLERRVRALDREEGATAGDGPAPPATAEEELDRHATLYPRTAHKGLAVTGPLRRAGGPVHFSDANGRATRFYAYSGTVTVYVLPAGASRWCRYDVPFRPLPYEDGPAYGLALPGDLTERHAWMALEDDTFRTPGCWPPAVTPELPRELQRVKERASQLSEAVRQGHPPADARREIADVRRALTEAAAPAESALPPAAHDGARCYRGTTPP